MNSPLVVVRKFARAALLRGAGLFAALLFAAGFAAGVAGGGGGNVAIAAAVFCGFWIIMAAFSFFDLEG